MMFGNLKRMLGCLWKNFLICRTVNFLLLSPVYMGLFMWETHWEKNKAIEGYPRIVFISMVIYVCIKSKVNAHNSKWWSSAKEGSFCKWFGSCFWAFVYLDFAFQYASNNSLTGSMVFGVCICALVWFVNSLSSC